MSTITTTVKQHGHHVETTPTSITSTKGLLCTTTAAIAALSK